MEQDKIRFSRRQKQIAILLLFGAVLIGSSIPFVVHNKQESTNGSTPATDQLSSSSQALETARRPLGQAKLVNSAQMELPAQATDLLLNFISAGYDALGLLEAQDITSYFASGEEAQESALINQTALDYLVAARRLQPLDLSFSEYSFTLNILEVEEQKDGSFKISAEENNAIRFAATADTESATSGIRHRFVIAPDESGWKIVTHRKIEDVYTLIHERYEQAGGEPETAQQTLSQIKTTLLDEAQVNASLREHLLTAYVAAPVLYDTPHLEADHPYDRQAAVEYARQWVSPDGIIRNPEWQVYDRLGGNCNNYISQCLYAGGIPMDIYGTAGAQWKWYGDNFNGNQTAKGRVPSWSGVEEFYQYALYNTGFGLVAWVDDNLYSGLPGDILQYGTEDEWKHSVIITGIIHDDAGQPVDYLIHSNTADRIDYPASAYSYPRQRLIKIYGWND